MAGALATGARCAALVGPYLSGKTTLFESILYATGAIPRKGSVKDGNRVGDAAPEARERQMSIEISVGTTEYLGDTWHFIDCPGSVELAQEARSALLAADTAVVVCEPSPERAMTLAALFKFLDEHDIPHMVFINKMDNAAVPVTAVLEALQVAAPRPLVLRQIPIADGDDITGYVDLVSERAYKYKPGEASEIISIPDSLADEHSFAREQMLESLADFDIELMEKLLEDTIPPTEEIYQQLTKDLRERLIVPVFFGSAENENGVRRLLKALRHETPSPDETAMRYGIDSDGEPIARVFKTMHAAHTGKLSIARLWRGELEEGANVNGMRIGGLSTLLGNQQKKLAKVGLGDVVALSRMDEVSTGDLLTVSGTPPEGVAAWSDPAQPVFSMAIFAVNRADEVKLTGALQRLNEEDPSLTYHQDRDTMQLVLRGQGDIHLQIALDKLKNRYNIEARIERPRVPYKETIRKTVSQHARFKRQTGGHGMFGDVHIEIKPLPRGTGFEFTNKIVGGAVPKQYIPAVEAGAKEFMDAGPLGFPVVDLSVTLTDGQFHAVDSNEMSFKLAAREAMKEGLPKCDPVLLEPILKVDIDVPTDFTNKVHGLVSGRRGQILGFNAKEGWKGWDSISVNMPHSEILDLIVELRSLTLGLGTYHAGFDHLQELTGRLAQQVVEQQKADADAS
jgi:elongation factor G